MGRRSLTPLAAFALVLVVAVPFVLRLSLLLTRGYNPDELEHLHWSWCVATGLTPYVDYFDHHTPWLHFLLAAFHPFFDLERAPNEAIAFVHFARRLMWIFAAGILLSTYLLGKAWRSARVGVLAAVLLSYTAFFLNKSLEIRPAVPAAALLVGSVLFGLLGMRRALSVENRRKSGARHLVLSGVLLGAATMFTQKVLFVGPGFALVSLWLVLDPRLPTVWVSRLKLASLQFVGFLVPLAGTLAYFGARGAVGAFIESNFIVNTRWPGLAAGPFLAELVRVDPAFVFLTVAGLVAGAVRTFQVDSAKRAEPVVWCVTASLVLTLPLHPAMSYQHFLLILPFAALYAALALDRAVTWGAGRLGSRPGWWEGFLVAAVLLLGITPLERFRASFERENWSTLEGIRYVLRNSSPHDTTMDGFTGLGMFRPQPFFHHFHYPHAYALQSRAEHHETLRALETGEAMPKLIFWSHYLREGVAPEVAAFLDEHYVPSGIEPIRVRPFDNGAGWWRDDDVRYLGWPDDAKVESPHVFFDDGWRVPTEEYGAATRRTRTRSSKLTVPVRRPRDFEAVFRAHADADAVPFGVELVVNGTSAGVLPAVPRWQDYRFLVPVTALIPGFNVFELKFSAEADDPSKRLELAVHTLQLVEAARGGR